MWVVVKSHGYLIRLILVVVLSASCLSTFVSEWDFSFVALARGRFGVMSTCEIVKGSLGLCYLYIVCKDLTSEQLEFLYLYDREKRKQFPSGHTTGFKSSSLVAKINFFLIFAICYINKKNNFWNKNDKYSWTSMNWLPGLNNSFYWSQIGSTY